MNEANHFRSLLLSTAWFAVLGVNFSANAGFKVSGEKVKSADDLWGINTTRGVRMASEKAIPTMPINTREDHLKKTVDPRIPNIQGNRELLRTMPTCFDPKDPARMPWYGNVENNIAAGGSGSGSVVTKSASWSITMKLSSGDARSDAPGFSVNADFPTETATYTVATADPVYAVDDPAAPTCSWIDRWNGTCGLWWLIDISFSSTSAGLSPLDVCGKPGLVISHGLSGNTVGGMLGGGTTVHQDASCMNGMTMAIDIDQIPLCGAIESFDCDFQLYATYTIHAKWEETSADPPPESGTVEHEPVMYSYDPKSCFMP